MLRSMHKFRADPTHPNWCSVCGRKEVTHIGKVRCPHCGASVPRVAGACPKCGQLVGVEPLPPGGSPHRVR